MMGIVYCYTSPSGHKYVGQTTNESSRRTKFKYAKNYSHGGKIDAARKKYGVDNFMYEVLETIDANTSDELHKKLNEREVYWIAKYDSFKNGYNSTIGGASSNGESISKALKGHNVSEETKSKIRNKAIARESYKALQKDRTIALQHLKEKCNKPVLQYTLNRDFIKEWESVTIAAKECGYCRTAISDCWNKGKASAYGFIWKLKSNSNSVQPVINKKNRIVQCDLNGNELNIYDSAKNAVVTLGLDNCKNVKVRIDAINAACKSGRTAYNFKWKYYDN